MVSERHAQSLNEFKATATETIDRIYKTGEVEMLTVETIVSLMMLIGGIIWLFGAKHLDDDTRKAEMASI